MEITMETKKAKSMATKVTAEGLKEMNSADLRKTATQLGIKNSKKYAKPDLLKLCLKNLPATSENGSNGHSKPAKSASKAVAAKPEVTSEVAVAELPEQEKAVEKVDVTKFPSSLEKDGKEFYQYYPYKKKFDGKLLSVFRKKNSDGKGSTCWIENPEGEKIFESKSWDESYFKAIKLRNSDYKDAKVIVYFDSEIPLPGSYGKTYN